jgi:hypothetical protein
MSSVLAIVAVAAGLGAVFLLTVAGTIWLTGATLRSEIEKFHQIARVISVTTRR